MMITAYAQAYTPDSLRIWVGLFDVENPPSPTLQVPGNQGQQMVLSRLAPIRDAMTSPQGKPLNHRAILQVTGLSPGTSYRITVVAGTEQFVLTSCTLPTQLPQKLEGTFNVLLCSCYSQPEDASGLLGTIVSQIKLRPHLTLMMGDQIYGDLPLFENLPDDDGIARKLGAKYRRNWASSQLDSGGLGPVLARAPVVCVADDHEFWNNFPFKQAQLPNTWTDAGRAQWKRIALALYEDYQLAVAAGGAQRIDVDPLKILVVDMRSLRDDQFGKLMAPSTVDKIEVWADDLIRMNAAGTPVFGMLCSGQALFTRPADEANRTCEDAELGNYAQFEQQIMPVLDRLAEAGIPVVYVTGDVHWGRVAQGVDVRSNRVMLFEVIASPSRLIRIPIIDKMKELGTELKGIFGKSDPWPRHSVPEPVPKRLGEKGHFRLQCDLKSQWGYAQRGDHVAIISFSRAAGGVDFNVTYYAITTDKMLSKSYTTRTYELRIH